MPAPDKKNPILKELESVFVSLQTWPERTMDKWQKRFENLHEANFQQGCNFAERGKLNDAMFRFKMALYFQNNFPLAWYNLGVVHIRRGDRRSAITALKKALSQKPDYTDAAYMLATQDPRAVPPAMLPTRMPAGMMEAFFTQAAPYYDALETQNNYHGPQVLVEHLRPHLPKLSGLTVVDAGCGTGHLAKLWRKVADRLVGVDVTPAMVEMARSAKAGDVAVFDAVMEADLRNAKTVVDAASADVVLCGNVVQFIGDLRDAIAAMAHWLKPEGLLAITAEPLEGASYGVVPKTSRFGHSESYVNELAQQSGLRVLRTDSVALYPNTRATLYIFKKAEAA